MVILESKGVVESRENEIRGFVLLRYTTHNTTTPLTIINQVKVYVYLRSCLAFMLRIPFRYDRTFTMRFISAPHAPLPKRVACDEWE